MAWTFDAGDQGWTGGTWDAANGSPDAGCLKDDNSGGGAPDLHLDTSFGVLAGQPFSCRVRIVAVGLAGGGSVEAYMSLFGFGLASEIKTVPEGSYDSGWFIISGTVSGNGTCTKVIVATILDQIDTIDFYVDTVHVGDAGPPMAGFEYVHSAGGIPGSVMI